MRITDYVLPTLSPAKISSLVLGALALASPALAAEADPAYGAANYFMMILSLAIVLGIIFVIFYFIKRFSGPKGGGRYVRFLDRTLIAPQTMLMICQVGAKYYVLASSPKEITVVDRLDEAPQPIASEAMPMSFKNILSQIQGKQDES